MSTRTHRARSLASIGTLLVAIGFGFGIVPAGAAIAQEAGSPPETARASETPAEVAVAETATAEEPDRIPEPTGEAAAEEREVDPAVRPTTEDRQPTPAEPQVGLRFRFQPWSEVLDALASQSGLPLVHGEPPTGTFNHESSRKYTLSEAIGILNEALLLRGHALLRGEDILVLVDLREGIPPGLVPVVSREEAAARHDFDLVTVRFRLGGRDPAEVQARIRHRLSPGAQAVFVPETGMLEVTEAAGLMSWIGETIAALPEPAQPAVAESPVTDPPAFEPPDREPEARDFEEPPAADPGPSTEVDEPAPQPTTEAMHELVVHHLRQIEAPAAVERLRREFPDARISAPPASHMLVAFASPEDQQAIAARIEQMEAAAREERPVDEERVEFHTYPVPRTERERIIAAIRDTLEERGEPGGGVFPAEDDEEIIVITVPRFHADIAELLAEELAAPEEPPAAPAEVPTVPEEVPTVPEEVPTVPEEVPAIPEEVPPTPEIPTVARDLAIYTVVPAADRLPIADETAVETRLLRWNRWLLERLRAAAPDARLRLAAPLGRLSVTATAEEHEVLSAVLEGLTAEGKLAAVRQVDAFALRRVEPAAMRELLSQHFPTAQFAFDAHSPTLLVAADADTLATIRAVVERLQPVVARPDTPELRAHTLPLLLPPTLIDDVDELAPTALIALDAASGRLLIAAVPEEHEAIADLFARLAEAAEAEEVLPEAVVEDPVVEEPETVEPVPDEPTVEEPVITEPLVEDPAVDEPLVEDPVVEEPTPEEPVEYTVPADRREEIENALAAIREMLPGIEVEEPSEPDHLRVRATAPQHALLAAAFERLEAFPDEAPPYRPILHSIERDDRESLRQVVARLFPAADFVLDDVEGRLLIWAPADEVELIEEALEVIDIPE